MRVWHYTIRDRLRSIMEDGIIKPASKAIPEGETPCIWFSAQPIWEPTANKRIMFKGMAMTLTTKEMFTAFPDDLIRLGYPSEKLLPWHILKRKVGMKHTEARRLVRSGKQMGAAPILWFGHIGELPLDQVTIEAWNPEMQKWGFFTDSTKENANENEDITHGS